MLALLLAAAPCPAPFAAWRIDAPAATALIPGRPARLMLRPVATLRFAAPPERQPGADARGIALPARAGRYAVALSEGLWLDLVRDGKPVAARGHDHGAVCAGIRKIVRFDLAPGGYTLQLSGSGPVQATVMIVGPEAGR